MPVLLVHGLRQTADSLLRTGDLPYAAGQQEEEEGLCKQNQALNVFYERDVHQELTPHARLTLH